MMSAGTLLSRKYDAGDGVAARLQICPKAWCVGASNWPASGPLDAEKQAAVQGIALIGQDRQSTRAFDGCPGAFPAPGHRALHIEQGRIPLIGGPRSPLPAGLHQDRHSLVLSAN
jgi:hypothetical protein